MSAESITKTIIVNIHAHRGVRPAYDVYIGRATKYTEFKEDSKWANPFKIQNYHNPVECLDAYEAHIRQKITENPKEYNIEELRGKRLGCWCKPGPCHGDILIKLLEEQSCLNCGQKAHTHTITCLLPICVGCSRLNLDCCGNSNLVTDDCPDYDDMTEKDCFDEDYEAELTEYLRIEEEIEDSLNEDESTEEGFE
jgi:hypothetical protein